MPGVLQAATTQLATTAAGPAWGCRLPPALGAHPGPAPSIPQEDGAGEPSFGGLCPLSQGSAGLGNLAQKGFLQR